jgi:hypothetical protein
LKARDPGRRDAPGKVLKDRRSHRQRGRMGTSVHTCRPTRLMSPRRRLGRDPFDRSARRRRRPGRRLSLSLPSTSTPPPSPSPSPSPRRSSS